MRFKSLNNFPPGGWKFYNAPTGWTATEYRGFQETRDEIIQHRRANPRFNQAIDAPSVDYELEQYNVARVLSMPGGRDYILDDDTPAPPSFPNRQRRAGLLGDAAEKARRSVIGAKTLRDWLGSGMTPVPMEQAEERASVCVACEFNQPGGALETLGETTLTLFEVARSLNLKTSKDEELKSCALCSCFNGLKVVVPLEHILKHQEPEVAAKLPSHCWIVQEQAQLSAVQPT